MEKYYVLMEEKQLKIMFADISGNEITWYGCTFLEAMESRITSWRPVMVHIG